MPFTQSGGATNIAATTSGSDIWLITLSSLPTNYPIAHIELWFHLLTSANEPQAVQSFQHPIMYSSSPITVDFAALAATLSMPSGYYRIEVRLYDENMLLNENPTFSNSSNLISFGVGGGGGENAICFLGSAPVLTPTGYRRIDSLSVGDSVLTADGRDAAIQHVKHQRVVTPSANVNPYVIPKGTFGATENLAISPRHCVAVPGCGMVEARELGLRQMSMRAAFDYYNLELPEWDNMVVAGVEVESLAPKKRVVMTAAQFRGLVAAQGLCRSTSDLTKLSQIVEMLADGRVAVMLTQKARRLRTSSCI
jgi:hypothetical protein